MKQNIDINELEQIYRQWPTERLVKAINIEADQYDPSAIAVMKRVLDGRGLAPANLDEVVSAVRSERQRSVDRLSRVRGWLVIFLLIVALNSVMQLLGSINVALNNEHWSLYLTAALLAAAGLYGLYCTFLLVRRRSRAPAHARRWILLSVAANLSTAALVYVVVRVISWSLVGSVMFAAIWLTYLSESKRVAFVYGPMDPADVTPEVVSAAHG